MHVHSGGIMRGDKVCRVRREVVERIRRMLETTGGDIGNRRLKYGYVDW